MPCGKRRPRYKSRKAAKRHAAITYGKKGIARKVSGGWSAYRR